LIAPVVATTIILGVLHAGMAVLHIDWIIIIITALISGYVVFLAASLAFGLDGDDRIILSAIGSRVRQTFRWSEAGV
jgi:TM2 domain-containing membrane protein YozV